MNRAVPKQGRKRLASEPYRSLRQEILRRRDGWRCQSCGGRPNLQVHHIEASSHLGDDCEQNLITLCANCHRLLYREGVRQLIEAYNQLNKAQDLLVSTIQGQLSGKLLVADCGLHFSRKKTRALTADH